jgi:drug/metabolite transporter (DMT)-like permease
MGVTFVLWGKALSLSAHTAKIANMIFLSPVLSLFFIHYIAKEQIYNSTVVALGLILFGLFLQQSKHENS